MQNNLLSKHKGRGQGMGWEDGMGARGKEWERGARYGGVGYGMGAWSMCMWFGMANVRTVFFCR